METANNDGKLAELEALLFIHGEPMTQKKIAAVLNVEVSEARSLIGAFQKKLESGERGLTLLLDGENVQFVTKPQFGKILEKFVKEELSEELTPASLESLAIIVYFGPISRNRIEYIRGVNSIFILRSLLLRGLVERFPDPERPNAYLYKPTFDFLKHLGLEGKEKLPEYEKFQSLLKAFESQIEIAGAESTPAGFAAAEKKENQSPP